MSNSEEPISALRDKEVDDLNNLSHLTSLRDKSFSGREKNCHKIS